MGTGHLTLYEQLRNCQLGEAGLIVGGSEESDPMREGLYIETNLDKVVKAFFIDQNKPDGKMLIILGSAGDGKSALLVNWNKRAKTSGVDPLPRIHLDATASFNPHEQYDVTLNGFLEASLENLVTKQGPRSALAINLGLAINFFETKDYKKIFPTIWSAINEVRTKDSAELDNIVMINLSRRDMFDTRPDHLGEGFLLDIINKFDFSDTRSPFYEAYQREKENCKDESRCILCYNTSKFTDPIVRKQVAKVLAARSLISNIHLNPRLIIHQVASILLNPELRQLQVTDGKCPLCHGFENGAINFEPEHILWNALFEQEMSINDSLAGLIDPIAQVNLSLDFQILNLTSSPKNLNREVQDIKGLIKTSKKQRQGVYISTLLRQKYLTGEEQYKTAIESREFEDFLGLYCLLRLDADQYKEAAGNVNSTLKTALRCWAGSVDESQLVKFFDGYKTPEFEFMSKWEDPTFSLRKSAQKTKESHSIGLVWVVLELRSQGGREIAIPLTFDIYLLMQKVIKGYNPSSIDMNRSEGIQLIASRLSDFTAKNTFIRIVKRDGDRMVVIKVDELDTIRIDQVR